MSQWTNHIKIWINPFIPLTICCWIWCLIMIYLYIGLDTNGTIFGTVYVLFALFLILIFQLTQELWQKLVIRCWVFIICYSVIVVCLNVFYQFHWFSNSISKYGINEKWQKDIGLIKFSSNKLLILHLFLKLAIIILTALLHIVVQKTVLYNLNDQFKFIREIVDFIDAYFDITTLTVFGIIISCTSKVNAVNFILILFAVISMLTRRSFRLIIIQFISVCSVIMILLQMIQQLHIFEEIPSFSCVNNWFSFLLSPEWFGLYKIRNSKDSMFRNVLGNIYIIILATIHAKFVKEKNFIERLKVNGGWNPYRIFNDFIYLESERNISSYAKYVLKYGFFSYGIEFSLISIAILIQVRLDFWALVYSLWLVILILCSYSFLSNIWSTFRIFIAFTISIQYAAALKFCSSIRSESHLGKESLLEDVLIFLPVGFLRPNFWPLFWDSVVFMCVNYQWNVLQFFKQQSAENYLSIISANINNIRQFEVHPTTLFGIFRRALYASLPIISAITFFILATKSITFFSIFYAIAFIGILWYSDNCFSISSNRILKFWKFLLIINGLMILIKTSLQIPGCLFPNYLSGKACWIAQLLGISCLLKQAKSQLIKNCLSYSAVVEIKWDVICLITLLFQNRFLRSCYFIEIMKEADLTCKYSHKAGEILEQLNQKTVKEMEKINKKNLKKIHKNMQRIRIAQEKLQGRQIVEPVTHYEVVTSGDYFMFEDTTCHYTFAEKENHEDKTESSNIPTPGKFTENVSNINDLEDTLNLKDDSNDSIHSLDESDDIECPKCLRKYKKFDEVKKQLEKDAKNNKKRKFPLLRKFQLRSKVTTVRTLSSTEKNENRLTENQNEIISEPEILKLASQDNVKNRRSLYAMITKFCAAFIRRYLISLYNILQKLPNEYRYVKQELEKYKKQDRFSSSTSDIQIDIKSSIEKSQDDERSLAISVRILLISYDLIMSHFNIICYFFILLLQAKDRTYFSLPLTFMVFCWGTLSVPRPSTRFWKIIFLYTTIILLIECICRSYFVIYTLEFYMPEFFKVPYDSSVYYLSILLSVFLQKNVLMSMGLWNQETPFYLNRSLFRIMYSSMKQFFQNLLYDRDGKIPIDNYTLIFLCDIINIFIFVYGFASMSGRKDEGVRIYFSENKIPPALFVFSVLQCLMILIDRWIYLRKDVFAKLIFQFVQIILIHFCLFSILPVFLKIRVPEVFYICLWYAIKCIYLLLSAYQIRAGYLTSAVYGHALIQSSYNTVNLYIYQIYLSIPFVYEIRALTDWMWTDTTLKLGEWIGLEDIFSTVYILKCWRNFDMKYSNKRGDNITSKDKYFSSGNFVLLLLIILFFPMAYFSIGRSAGQPNLPLQMELSFRIDNYPSIFSAFTTNIRGLSEIQWAQFMKIYKKHPSEVTTFLQEYDFRDVGIIRIPHHSHKPWFHYQIFVEKLLEDINSHGDDDTKIVTLWTLHRKIEDGKEPYFAHGFHEVRLKPFVEHLRSVLKGKNDSFTISNIAPKFLKVTNFAHTSPINFLMDSFSDYNNQTQYAYANLTFVKKNTAYGNWCLIHQNSNEKSLLRRVDDIISNNDSDKYFHIITFNERILPGGMFGILSYLGNQGIVGIYTTFLLTFGFFIRKYFRGRTQAIFLDYIPNVDCILQLILDIYFVREHKEKKLEEELYAKLIFLFRSPETLIKWTRLNHKK